MTYALIGLIVAQWLFLMWLQLRIENERKAWAEERRELANRIQRPDILPTRPVENFTMPERKPDEWDKVGTVEYDVSGNGADG